MQLTMNTVPTKDPLLWAKLMCATILCLSGIVLLFVGLYAPPEGVIDSSVLVAFGEVMTFSGALFGIAASLRR